MNRSSPDVDASVCPSEETIQRFLTGALSPLEVERVALHLSTSPSCRCHRFCDDFAEPPDRLIQGLQRPKPRLPHDSDACFQELLHESVREGAGNCVRDVAELAAGNDHDSRSNAESPVCPRVLGPFQLVEPIGRGGMGDVFRAVDSRTRRQVALKLIRMDRFSDEEFIRRFRDEARTAAQLDHPNIVPVYEVDFSRSPSYLVMKLIDGHPLSELAADEPPDATRVANWMISIAEAVHYAHQRRVIHRDLKPANVLVDQGGCPYVTDFGLSKRIGADSMPTQSSGIVGTPGYMAPEQVVGDSRRITTAVDVYGLGSVLYFMLTGQAPFCGNRTMDVLRAVVDREPKRPSQLCAGIPQDLETICMKCLAKDPLKRYSSAEEVAKDLRRWLAMEPIHARPQRWTYRMQRWCQRRPLVAALATVALLLTLTVSVGGPLAAVIIQRRSVEAYRNLFELQIALARAERYNEIPNHRETAWKAINGALQAAHSFELSREQKLNVRNEAIAAMAYPDVSLQESWSTPSAYPAVDDSLRIFAYATAQGDLVVRDMKNGRERARFPGPRSTTDAILVSPAARYLAVAYVGNSANQHMQDLIRRASRVMQHLQDLDLQPDDLRWLGRGPPATRRLALYSVEEARPLWTNDFGLIANQLAFSSDGNLIAGVSADGRIDVFETRSGKRINRLYQKDLNRFAWRPHSSQITIADQTNIVRSFNVFNNQLESTFRLPGVVEDITWQTSGDSFAAISERTIYLWDAKGNRLKRIFREHQSDPIVKVSFGSGDRLCASVGHDGKILVWAPHSGRLLTTIKGLYPSADETGSKLTTTSVARGKFELNLWNIKEPAELSSFQVGADSSAYLQSVAYSSDGRMVAACGDDGLFIWESGQPEQGRFVPLLDAFGVAAGAETGQWLVSSKHGLLSVQMNRSSGLPAVIKDIATVRPSRYYHLAASRDGSRLGVSSGAGQLLLLDLEAGVERYVAIENDESPIAVSPDGKWFASLVGARNELELLTWDFRSGQRLAKVGDCEKGYNRIAIANDGRRIVVGSSIVYRCFERNSKGTWVHLYDVPRQEVGIWGAAAFSHDGRDLAVVDTKDVVRIVDASTGARLCRLLAPSPRFTITDLSFSPDDRILAVVGEDRHIQCWNLRLIRAKLAEMQLDWRK